MELGPQLAAVSDGEEVVLPLPKETRVPTCCECGKELSVVYEEEIHETFIVVGPPVYLEDGTIGYTCQDCFDAMVQHDVEECMQHAMEKDA